MGVSYGPSGTVADSVVGAAANLLEQVPAGLIAVDASGTPRWWNDTAHSLVGADLARSTLADLEAWGADPASVFEVRTAPGTADDGAPVTWVVVTPAPQDPQLLDAFAHQALHDHLTGLPNRTLLADRLEQALDRAARSGRAVAVAFLDLDHFKLINDTQGHAEGDALLRAVADRLRETVRSGDTVARFGGDEFVIVCDEVAGADEAMELADRLRAAIAAPLTLRGEEVFVSASLGVALGDATDTPERLLRDADTAMYHAKTLGRARAELFDEGIRARAERRHYLERSLRRALDEHQFSLVYQPIVALDAGWVVGAEALVRWHDPGRGTVMPEEFIAVAEDTGLIVPLGEWILHEACRQLRQWRTELPRVPLYMSVNLSPRQLRTGVAEAVRRTTRANGLEPSALMLEITEGALMDDVARCLATLEELSADGVRLAIDDFGVGHSSLNYLKRFPIDVIKVDRAFVNGLGTDPGDTAIVTAIAGMARALRVSVIAEGVETPEQLYALRHLGCHQAQGFQFASPLPPTEFAALVREGHRW